MRTAIRVLCAAGILAALTPGGIAHAGPAGTTPVNAPADGPSLSADGRFAAFWSSASDLVPGDTNRVADVFVRDRQSGETTRVSRGRYEREAENDSLNPSISADGRFVAFDSLASNLISRDWNIYRDVFVHDRNDGRITKASIETNGFESNGPSQKPSISADGRYVAFESAATNLAVWPDNNRAVDVFVRDRETGRTNRVSVSSANIEGDSASWQPSISADGRYVVYTSGATNLVPGDTPPGAFADVDVFLFDRETWKTTQVNLRPDGTSTGWSSNHRPAISADGRFVAFQSAEEDLVAGDTNGSWDIFLRDVVTRTTTRVSVDSAGAEANGNSLQPAISADGRHVAFTSYATNLGAGNTFGYSLYVRDLGD